MVASGNTEYKTELGEKKTNTKENSKSLFLLLIITNSRSFWSHRKKHSSAEKVTVLVIRYPFIRPVSVHELSAVEGACHRLYVYVQLITTLKTRKKKRQKLHYLLNDDPKLTIS